jgi:hypothetical protein
MTRKLGAVAFLIALTAASAVAIAAASGESGTDAAATAATSARAGPAAGKKPLRYEANDFYIETNATDRDAGLQLKLDAENWKWLKIRDPKGRLLVDFETRGRLRPVGLSELFFEASEPSFDEVPFSKFKKRFTQGRYTFRGRTSEGREIVGSDRLSHLVPAAPKVTFPTNGAEVDRNGLTATWEPVTSPAGVDITSYIVTVNQENRELDMELPASATSASIPAAFLKPGTKTGLEVLSREKSGNQTITAISFRTK